MSSPKKVVLTLSCALLLSLVFFNVLRTISLTHRLRTLESLVDYDQELYVPLSGGSTDSVYTKAAPPDGSKHKVLNVIDGDTVKVETAEGSLSLRVIGIDTPETVHPFKPIESGGPEASQKARELLEGSTVVIHYDPNPKHGKWDKYGRLLAYLDLPDGRDFGLLMINAGLARAYPKYPFSRQDTYLAAERTAQQEKTGIWDDRDDPCEPTMSDSEIVDLPLR